MLVYYIDPNGRIRGREINVSLTFMNVTDCNLNHETNK